MPNRLTDYSDEKEAFQKYVGSVIKQSRKQKDISIRELEEQAGFSTSFLSQIENGKVSANSFTLFKIAETLDIAPETFFTPYVEDNTVPESDDMEDYYEFAKEMYKSNVPIDFLRKVTEVSKIKERVRWEETKEGQIVGKPKKKATS